MGRGGAAWPAVLILTHCIREAGGRPPCLCGQITALLCIPYSNKPQWHSECNVFSSHSFIGLKTEQGREMYSCSFQLLPLKSTKLEQHKSQPVFRHVSCFIPISSWIECQNLKGRNHIFSVFTPPQKEGSVPRAPSRLMKLMETSTREAGSNLSTVPAGHISRCPAEPGAGNGVSEGGSAGPASQRVSHRGGTRTRVLPLLRFVFCLRLWVPTLKTHKW